MGPTRGGHLNEHVLIFAVSVILSIARKGARNICLHDFRSAFVHELANVSETAGADRTIQIAGWPIKHFPTKRKRIPPRIIPRRQIALDI